MKRVLYFLILLFFSVAWVSCTNLDKNYDDMVPPKVDLHISSVCGIVMDGNGDPVMDAVITVDSLSAKTDGNGNYNIIGLNPGRYTVSVKADGKNSVEGEVVIDQFSGCQIIPFNTILLADCVTTQSIRAEEGGTMSMVTSSLKGNDNAQVPIQVEIPANALSSDGTLALQQIPSGFLTVGDSAVTSEELLLGFSVSAKSVGMELLHPASVVITLDKNLAEEVIVKKWSGSQWHKMDNHSEKANLRFDASEFGTYGLFVPMKVSEALSRQSLAFESAIFDNMYGATPLEVSKAAYSYAIGSEVNLEEKSVLSALLTEKLAATYGAGYIETTGTCNIGVTLPIGSCLKLEGSQEKRKVSVSACGRAVKITTYGKVAFSARAYDREGTGGSN